MPSILIDVQDRVDISTKVTFGLVLDFRISIFQEVQETKTSLVELAYCCRQYPIRKFFE
jgi:hypothetical protein